MFRGVLVIKQRYDQHLEKTKSPGFKILPPEEEEGRLTRASTWSAAAAEDWPGDFFFLRVVTLV